MILYNTLMGVAAGLALIMVPLLARKLLLKRESIAAEGWALSFGILGIILTFLGGLMAVTWPLNVNPPINIAFAEPTLFLGLLLLAAALFLWHRKELLGKPKDIVQVLTPVSWVLFVLGLILISCTAAILRFTLVGSAPAAEPISGLLHDYPLIENTFFAVLYGLSALGALLAPFALRNLEGKLPHVVGWSWVTAGVLFVAFSVMNYYTHIGLLVNLLQGKNFEF